MMKCAPLLAVIAVGASVPAAAQGQPVDAAAIPQEEAVPPVEQSAARRVIEAQLRQPPRLVPRQQSRIERQRLVEQYLKAIGAPIDRRAGAAERPR